MTTPGDHGLRHVFGPVRSRRLGRSLGIDPVPLKTCNFNCVYCQLGRTPRLCARRRRFFDASEMIA
jgi:wyosine [tRNA(Phe)-imidazoG37] synthetase (radical SAM superfamily)